MGAEGPVQPRPDLWPIEAGDNAFMLFEASMFVLIPSGAMVKNLPASAGSVGDMDLIPGLGSSHGGGNGNPLQYSCLKNTMDRGSWWL